MDRLAILFISLGLFGCALAPVSQTYAPLSAPDVGQQWRQQLRTCGTVIGACGSVVW